MVVWMVTQRIINRFKEEGATSPATARTLEELRLRGRRILRRMIRQGVLVETHSYQYYLDETQLSRYNRRRAIIMLIVLVAIVSILLLVNYFVKRQ
jgi:predicted nuclease with RNAse H fold